MYRMRTTVALGAIVVVLAACGPAASSNSGEPSAEASSAASVAASEPQASVGGVLPSSGAVPELEALIPSTIGEITMTKSSMRGDVFLTEADADPDVAKFLEDLGVPPSDVGIAYGFGYTPDFSSTAYMFVIRAEGADSGRLTSAFKTAFDTGRDEPLAWSSTSIGGKQVESAVDSEDSIFLYVKGDTLFYVGSSDTAISEQIIQGLP